MLSPSDLANLAQRAGVPVAIAEHHAPLLALFAAMLPAASTPASVDLPPGFDPHKSYTAAEAAVFLGLSSKSVYEIPDGELPRTRVGGTRTAVRFVGLDLLCYRQKLPLIDWTAVRDEAEAQLLRVLPAVRGVRAMPSANGKTRVV